MNAQELRLDPQLHGVPLPYQRIGIVLSRPCTHNPRLRKMPMASFQFNPVKRKETMGNVRTEIGHVGAG
ncbi:hypothetical protein COLSTE_01314 [Collinsella stercoris DSM 13279]|uniref:Uncharacterized protein n=1 Tax=Collinsella stercoris DSM 13279 TaxID=445975 RepID=B6GB55_9ACTN|nr:hypothetical protein COLSTE_01314 [Collinsella stercoris DSM 13279]